MKTAKEIIAKVCTGDMQKDLQTATGHHPLYQMEQPEYDWFASNYELEYFVKETNGVKAELYVAKKGEFLSAKMIKTLVATNQIQEQKIPTLAIYNNIKTALTK
jgi:hypothetical protein